MSDKKKKKSKKKEIIVENGDDEFVEEYTPKISSPSNHKKFLRLFDERSGSLSSDDGAAPHHSDGEGFIEDDIIGNMETVGKDDSPYDNLGSPTFETAQAAGETTGDAPQTPEEKEQQMQEWREELARVEGEIVTLKQVLGSKVRFAAELKRKLGISPLQEFKQDFSEGLRTIKESETYVKTNEKLHQINDRITHSSAYQKTSAAAKTAAEKTTALATAVGQSVSKKIGDIRNSQTFKSMEGRIESTVATVKSKVVGSKSEGDFEEALKSDQAGNGAAPTVTEQPKTLPEDKVPL